MGPILKLWYRIFFCQGRWNQMIWNLDGVVAVRSSVVDGHMQVCRFGLSSHRAQANRPISTILHLQPGTQHSCLGGAVARCRTRDRKVVSSTLGRCAIKSTRSTQPSILLGWVNRVPACMAGVRRGAFTCVVWQVIPCDSIWQVTSRSFEVGFPQEELCWPLQHRIVLRPAWHHFRDESFQAITWTGTGN